MRPVKLSITAFGPFKDRTVIDFSLFGDEGLFLICGATGSGKTTIFDALSYALFGVTTNEGDRNASQMRCQWASGDNLTEVELVFQEKDRRYTVIRTPAQQRPKKRGDGHVDQPASATLYLPEGKVLTKVDQVNGRIVEIVGMNGSQFSQIVMLAQGRFSRFLNSTSDEKRELFKKIFSTEGYGELQDILQAKANEARDAYRAIGEGQKAIVKTLSLPDSSPWHSRLVEAQKADVLPEDIVDVLEGMRKEAESDSARAESQLAKASAELKVLEAHEEERKRKEDLRKDYAAKEEDLAQAASDLAAVEEEAKELPTLRKRMEETALEISTLEKALPTYDQLDGQQRHIIALEVEKGDLERSLADDSRSLDGMADRLGNARKEVEDLSSVSARLAEERACGKSLTGRLSLFEAIREKIGEKERADKEAGLVEGALSSLDAKEHRLEGDEKDQRDAISRTQADLDALKDLDARLAQARDVKAAVDLLVKNLDEIAAKRVEEESLAGEVARYAGELAASRDRHSALIRSWYLHSAYALAQTLEEGKACPVCGAVHHPDPAKVDSGSCTRQELDEAGEDERKAEDALRKAEKAKEKVSGVLSGILGEMERRKASLPDQLRTLDMDQMCGLVSSQLAQLEAELARKEGLSRALGTLEAELERIVKDRVKLAEERKEVEQKLGVCREGCLRLEAQLDGLLGQAGVELAGIQSVHSQLEAQMKDCESRIARLCADEEKARNLARTIESLAQGIEDLRRKMAEDDTRCKVIEKEVQLKREEVEKLRLQLPYASRQEAQGKLSSLGRAKAELDRRIRGIEDRRRAALERKASLEGSLKELAGRLSAIADHDIEALGRQLAQVGILVSSLDREHRSCDVRLENISKALERFMADEAEAEVLRHRWASLKELADVANGNLSGEDRLSLETYVQTRYLDRILRRANGKLLAMTNGQYEMERSGEGRGRRRKMGLDIDVMDHFTGKSRAASTLSGGEGFKASLALALGLSEEIQAQAGAVRIETMFVDEGFGTLDDESLASALSTLSGLASSGRLVGVISHVAELKGRIDRQILVEKGRADGSTVRLKC